MRVFFNVYSLKSVEDANDEEKVLVYEAYFMTEEEALAFISEKLRHYRSNQYTIIKAYIN